MKPQGLNIQLPSRFLAPYAPHSTRGPRAHILNLNGCSQVRQSRPAAGRFKFNCRVHIRGSSPPGRKLRASFLPLIMLYTGRSWAGRFLGPATPVTPIPQATAVHHPQISISPLFIRNSIQAGRWGEGSSLAFSARLRFGVLHFPDDRRHRTREKGAVRNKFRNLRERDAFFMDRYNPVAPSSV